MKLSEIYSLLDSKFPFALAMSYDNSGYMVGDPNSDIRRVLLCLDCTAERVQEAREKNVQLILSHHPVIFKPLSSVTRMNSEVVFELVRNDIASIAMHTNLDIADGGLNDSLAQLLELNDIVKFNVLEDGETAGLGRMGKSSVNTAAMLCSMIKEKLGVDFLRSYIADENVNNIAVITGSGAKFLKDAKAAGADVFITGDCRYYDFEAAKKLGITLIDAGHFYTERIAVGIFRKALEGETDLELIESSAEADITVLI